MNPCQRDEAVCRLDELPLNTDAEVLDVGVGVMAGAAEQALRLRLMEIGFLPGEPVRVIAQGFPAQDPLAVRIGLSTFALRGHEAAFVRVRQAVGI